MKTATHLHFKGNAREAFDYYARALNGRVTLALTYAESPMATHVPAAMHNQLMHVRLEHGEQVLLGCDASPEHYTPTGGFSITVLVDAPQEAERVFRALADGGSVGMPFGPTFWSQGFGMCTDRFGIPWMVNCERTPAAAAA
ncbi:MAG: VOC family protein [Gammaproteobacteria bacterium]|nr:VOC family protein [Gammaproteobacteria bacterium]MBV9621100.1 VOC family protein [Gammaproteobacteria bacterium]